MRSLDHCAAEEITLPGVLYALADPTRLQIARVLSDGGFFNAVKCQRCLHSLERDPAPPFGSYVPLGLEISRSMQ